MPSRVYKVRRPSILLVGSLVLLAACGESGPSALVDPSRVRDISGAALSGTAGQPLSDRVTVRVEDASDNPLEGIVVTFAVTVGGGTVAPASATTDDNGEASTRWTLGPSAGSNVLTASVAGGASAQITATGNAGRPASVSATAGNNQSATAGSPVATNPAVVVLDANNNPVQGATVVFSAVAGGGQVTDPVRQTNALGVATVGQWRLGNSVGPQTLTAVVAEAGVSAVFTATATAGAPASIVAVSPSSQSAGAGSLVPNPPSVRVNDANGNPVANAQVTFAVTAGGGQLSGATQTTNAQGIATVTSWVLGGAVGLNTVSATVAGVPAITFSATATAGPPVFLAISDGDGQLVPINRPAPIAPQVIVRDANGNPVSGASVTFTVGSGGGLVISGNQTTNASGLATVGAWFMGGSPGPNTLVATSPGLVPVTFDATATAGPPVSLQAVSLVSQGGTAGANVASPPSVVVRDALGNPASGIEVTFSVTSGGGTVIDPVQITGLDGVATVTAWTLGVTPGVNTVVASSPGLPSVMFTASSVGPAAQVVSFAGNGQAAVQGNPVPTRPAVRVLDAGGNGVPGTSVVFAVTGGGGSVTGASQITDVNGIATVGSWTLGSTVGQTLSATVGVGGVAGNPVTFSASAATQIIVTAAPASAPAGSNFSITVELRNANNLLSQASNVPLTIAIQTGGGTLNGTATVNTNATGMVTFTINVTGAAGNRTFRITGAGLTQAITGNVNIT